MAGTNTWKLLEFGQDLPRLLLKTRFDNTGYDIQLTDLSRIWSETLKHEAIVERAAEEGCSIDPSEYDQYQILLDKIDGAITGVKGTNIELRHDDVKNDLSLDLSAPLPGSLPPLKWSIRFEQRRQSDIAGELVRPLLQQANHLRHQVQFLVDEVTAKDRVIAKITDRLESSGNDLTTVFPGVSNIKTNRKRSQREQLATHVKGLADFDEKSWRASIAPKIDHFEVSPNLLNDLLSDLPAPNSSDFHENASGEWWKRVRYGRGGETRRGSHDGRNGRQECQKDLSAQLDLSVDQSVEDDEFQKQETPPHLKHRAHARHNGADAQQNSDVAPQSASPAVADDDETDDDGDLDAVPSHASSSQSKGRSQQEPSQKSVPDSEPRPVRKLGAIGGEIVLSSTEADGKREQEEAAPMPSRRKAKLGTIGGKKAKSTSPEPERKDSPPTVKKKTKLGSFGGKKRSAIPETEDEETAVSPPRPKSKLGAFGGRSNESHDSTNVIAAQDQPPPAKAKHKLGTLGGKKQTSSQRGVPGEPDKSPARSPAKHKIGIMGERSSTKATDSPPPSAPEVEKVSEAPEVEETPEERANRKRERLKKEMQEKHPVKKRRKF